MYESVSGEVGLVISSVNEQLYTGFYKGPKEMNEKKFVRDVFKKGDRFFSFGDLVYLDKNYNIYFRDRTGDTFRFVKRCICSKFSSSYYPFSEDSTKCVVFFSDITILVYVITKFNVFTVNIHIFSVIISMFYVIYNTINQIII